MLHPEQSGVKKATIKAEMSKKFKASEDRIAVFGIRNKFGGGRSSCFVHVFDDLDSRKKYDTKANLARDKVVEPLKKPSRKMAKDLKGKRKRVKGTAKSKVQAGKQKR